MRTKRIAYIGVLIGLLGMTCSGQSIRVSTTDSLRKLLPKGFVVFTEAGARDALKAKVDAGIMQKQLWLKDSALVQKDVVIDAKNQELFLMTTGAELQKKELRKAKTTVVLKTIEVWTLRAALILKIVRVW